jgi:2,3-diketo-5-methylthio-1-phosphopentane phosphatase
VSSSLSHTWVLDFDGTIVSSDIGDELCDRFAPAEWLEIDQRWERRELSLPEAQRQMWALTHADQSSMVSAALEMATIRNGFNALLDLAEDRGARLILASGGFDFYIGPILGGALERFEATFFNTGQWTGGKLTLGFPNAEKSGCSSCAVCKGRVCATYAERGPVTFFGDGTSDRCAIGVADRIAAVQNSKLAGYCKDAGVEVMEFSAFSELFDWL